MAAAPFPPRPRPKPGGGTGSGAAGSGEEAGSPEGREGAPVLPDVRSAAIHPSTELSAAHRSAAGSALAFTPAFATTLVLTSTLAPAWLFPAGSVGSNLASAGAFGSSFGFDFAPFCPLATAPIPRTATRAPS